MVAQGLIFVGATIMGNEEPVWCHGDLVLGGQLPWGMGSRWHGNLGMSPIVVRNGELVAEGMGSWCHGDFVLWDLLSWRLGSWWHGDLVAWGVGTQWQRDLVLWDLLARGMGT